MCRLCRLFIDYVGEVYSYCDSAWDVSGVRVKYGVGWVGGVGYVGGYT